MLLALIPAASWCRIGQPAPIQTTVHCGAPHLPCPPPPAAGKDWYELPATKITDEVKRDLRLLKLRGVYDPKRFYKSFDDSKFPKYFQVRPWPGGWWWRW
jgi:hypothetical protein